MLTENNRPIRSYNNNFMIYKKILCEGTIEPRPFATTLKGTVYWITEEALGMFRQELPTTDSMIRELPAHQKLIKV